MTAATGALEDKTRANHYKGRFRIAMGGHLYLRSSDDPALIFRAHPFFQKRYELQIRLIDIKSVTGGTGGARMTVELSDGASELFLVAAGTGLIPEMQRRRRALDRRSSRTRRGGPVDRRGDDEAPRYWATGSYDPERYYRETSGWSREYREYVRDAYGDLDTYNANKPD